VHCVEWLRGRTKRLQIMRTEDAADLFGGIFDVACCDAAERRQPDSWPLTSAICTRTGQSTSAPLPSRELFEAYNICSSRSSDSFSG